MSFDLDNIFADLAADEGQNPDVTTDEVDETTEALPDEENDLDADAEEQDEDTDGEDEEGENEPSEPVTITPDQKFVLEDGTEITGEELMKQRLLHQDYTRKRQAESAVLREKETQLQQISEWWEEKAADPVGFLRDIALETGNADAAVLHLVIDLAAEGKLNRNTVEGLAEAFGLDEGQIPELARANARDRKLAAIEARNDADRTKQQQSQTQAQSEEAVSALAQSYQQQLAELADKHGLTREQQVAVMELAVEEEITKLSTAFDLYNARNKPAVDPAKVAREQKAKQLLDKKRKAGAITPTARTKGRADKPVETLNDALENAWSKLSSKFGE